jgi:CO/xanthine dehydrogenase Mo-binding subunit
MGQVVNPQGATIQMEGCITMGLGYALSEELHFSDGRLLDVNFDTYAIPRFSWLPRSKPSSCPIRTCPQRRR